MFCSWNLNFCRYSLGIGSESDPSSHSLTLATRDVFGDLDRSHRPVAPDRFLKVLIVVHFDSFCFITGSARSVRTSDLWHLLLGLRRFCAPSILNLLKCRKECTCSR